MPVIEAAGGVVWRPGEAGGADICLVHRPKYDDWSLPKGKLVAGEHPILGAVREVREETGVQVTVGPPLGEIRYLKDGRPKRVRYWSMRARDEVAFEPNWEVDELRWVPPSEATRMVVPERDAPVIARFDGGAAETRPLVLLRHARVGGTEVWAGGDGSRALDGTGRRQAELVAELLDAYAVRRVVCAALDHCVDTVAPFTLPRGVPVDTVEWLGRSDGTAVDGDAVRGVLDRLGDGGSAVVGTGEALAALLRGLCAHLDHPQPTSTWLDQAASWIVQLSPVDGSVRSLEISAPVGEANYTASR